MEDTLPNRLSDFQQSRPAHQNGLRFIVMKLEKLAADWSRLATYASRFNYYPKSLSEREISEMATTLSGAVERAMALIDLSKQGEIPEQAVAEAEKFMTLALYAEHLMSEIRKRDFFNFLWVKDHFSESVCEESAEERFLKELSEISGGEAV